MRNDFDPHFHFTLTESLRFNKLASLHPDWIDKSSDTQRKRTIILWDHIRAASNSITREERIVLYSHRAEHGRDLFTGEIVNDKKGISESELQRAIEEALVALARTNTRSGECKTSLRRK